MRSSCPDRSAAGSGWPVTAVDPPRTVLPPACLTLHVIGGDEAGTSRLERAVSRGPGGRVVVTTELAVAVAARESYPHAWIVVAGLRRCEVSAALEAGADLALWGPLRAPELRAAIAGLARSGVSRRPAAALELDADDGVARLDGVPLALSRGEHALLRRLSSCPGRVFTKAELAGPDGTVHGRALERRVARLRARLGDRAGALVTIHGVGYRLDLLA